MRDGGDEINKWGRKNELWQSESGVTPAMVVRWFGNLFTALMMI